MQGNIEALKKLEESELAEIYQKHFKELCKNDATEKQAMAAALILAADEIADDYIFHDDRRLIASEIQAFLLTKKSSINQFKSV